jgi:threonine/homoserine/homoserine lactone efflux protein
MLGIHDLSLFVVSGLLLNIMPGPDSLLIMTRSATQGWRAGSAAALGIGTGTFVHIFAAALGMSAILATSAAAFTVVKLLGAAYILYLAVGMLLSKRGDGSAVQAPALAPLPLRRIYGQGILTNVLNPKVALFFLAFVPQFIDANAPHKALAFIVLGAIFNINGMLWCHALALFTAQARARLKLNPAVTQWLNRATGGLFVWLGVKLALAKQH